MNSTKTLAPDAVARLDQWRGKMRQGNWGDGVERVCLMSALVPGARNAQECVTAGWPEWLVLECVALYDDDTGADDEQAAADEWAYRMAEVVSKPVDYRKALDRYHIGMLRAVRAYDYYGVVKMAIDLLERRIEGADEQDALMLVAATAHSVSEALYELARLWTWDRRKSEAASYAADLAEYSAATMTPASLFNLDAARWVSSAIAAVENVDWAELHEKQGAARRDSLTAALAASTDRRAQ